MKRIILSLTCLFLLIEMVPAAGVTLTAPNGFEFWGLGSKYKITWMGDKMRGPLRLVLMSGNRMVGDIAVNLPLLPSEFLWTAGELLNGPTAKVGRYRVRILDEGALRQDDSNNDFDLVGAMRHEITSPQLGSVWSTGETHVIRWKDEGKPQVTQAGATNVKICLIYGISPGVVATIAHTGNDGQYEWNIPHSILLSEYRVQIVSGTPGTSSYKYGTSQVFKIQPKIIISQPLENSSLFNKEKFDISWSVQGQGYSSTTMIYLMDTQLKNKIYTVANTPTSPGHFQWLIPPPTTIPRGTYRIQLEIRGNPFSNVLATGASKTFSVKPSFHDMAPSMHKQQIREIKVTSPMAGATWRVGEEYDITWTKQGDLAQWVQIVLYKDDHSQSIMTLGNNVENNKSFRWKVPFTGGIPEGKYSILVQDGTSSTKGWSANFYIRK